MNHQRNDFGDGQPRTGETLASAAKLLKGKELIGGWKVIHHLTREEKGSTGGSFSESYIIEDKDGKKAFLKAVDFSKALGADDPAKKLEEVTKAFNFERQILKICAERRMSRVVTPIESGVIDIQEAEGPPVTQYLIFELADGNLRYHISKAKEYENAWKFSALHQIAVGMDQLHNGGISHQDLKPSNVLMYNGNGAKLCDLGRSISKDLEAPHQDYVIAGDRGYAPPELIYQYIHPDINVRRFACDAYLMGSMVCFIFTGVPFVQMMLFCLRNEHKPANWGGDFHGVLPYLRDAFGLAIDRFSMHVPDQYRERLTTVVQQLCEPDPNLRGHPRSRLSLGNSYRLDRYISLFDLLATSARALRH